MQTNLNNVFTFSEAAERWGLSDGSVLRNAIRSKRLEETEYRRSGDVWLVSREGMNRLYGFEPQYRNLDFVMQRGLGVEGLGIIEELVRDRKGGQHEYNVMSADMDEDFGCWKLKQSTLVYLNPLVAKEKLEEISKNQDKFAYFIIQLNDIKKLKEFHITENEYVQQIRKQLNEEE